MKSKGIIVLKRILTLIFIAESVVWLALPIMAFSDEDYFSQDSSEDTYSVDTVESDYVEDENSDIYEYDLLADGTVEIVSYCGTDSEIIIPAKLDGYTVSSIGECAFYGEKRLKKITVSEGIQIIGMSAFQHMRSLNTVVLPNTITMIDNLAFAENKALTDIVIPDGVKTIEAFAFAACESITQINIPASVSCICLAPFDGCQMLQRIDVDENNEYYSSEDGVLFNKDKTELICYPAAKDNLVYLIPETVTTIKSLAFSGNSNLDKIRIPESVIAIEGLAFYDCPILTIHGYKDTEAEYFADENSIQFVLLNSTVVGDVDGNGVLDYNDYAIVIAYVRCEHSISNEADEIIYFEQADVNGDGAIDAMDAIEMELRINGVIIC